MINVLMVFLGGGAGSVLRYLLKIFCEKNLIGVFPFATFAVNILGSFFLGVISALFLYKTDYIGTPAKVFLTIGLAGGFTTFSTYSFEVVELFKEGHFLLACAYSALSVIISLVAVILGSLLVKIIWS